MAEGSDGLLSSAEQALRIATLDPAGARRLSGSVLEAARRQRCWEAVCAAERALGVAAMTLSEIDDAVAHLRAAVRAGLRAGSRRGVAEARMSLASALVLRGRPVQASHEIEAASRELTGVPAARAHVQRAAILQELGADDGALVELRRALPTLRRSGDAEWAARGLSNRSLIHVKRRSFGAAEADLVAARRLCVEHDLQLPAGYAEQNLGVVKAQRGEVPVALELLDAAAERYRRFGVVEPSLLLDRAGVLLSVRLLGEARSAAEAAVAAYDEQRRVVHLPEAQLMLSTVALLQQDTTTATASAEAAVRGFRRLGHAHSLALARYSRVQALYAADPGSVEHTTMARVADELDGTGWRVPALEARVLAGRIALDHGRLTAARRHLATASRARAVGPADARARAWLAEALLRRADGRRAAALSALRAGIRIVEEHQATLGAVELRATVSVHRGALARWGLRMALEDADARRSLWWAERSRASALLNRPALPPSDAPLAQDLADLRSTMAEQEEARNEGHDDRHLVRRQVGLERRIRDRSRSLRAAGGDPGHRSHASVEELTATLGDTALVEFVELDGALHAVTVCDGRVRLHHLGEMGVVQDLLVRVPFALRRLTHAEQGRAAGLRAAMATLDRTGTRFDELLLRPLSGDLGLERAGTVFDDLLLRPLSRELRDRALVVVPTGALQSMPWSILPSCHGRPVTISPSARLWQQAATRPRPEPDAPVVVVAGPGLAGAVAEASAVAGMYPGSTLLQGAAATAGGVSARTEGAAVLHLAAHGRVRSDNPLFSSVVLADGPLTVYELERLRRAPHHVVLSACDTGRAQTVAGEEVLGFGAAMLAGGTATLVAPVVAVPDLATVPLMTAYHRGLRRGRSPSEALALAQAEADPADPVRRAAAAAFVCLGAG